MLLREVIATYAPAKRVPGVDGRIGSSRDVDVLLRSGALAHVCAELPVEAFLVLHLDAKNRVIGWHRAGLGGTDTCPVQQGAIYRPLLLSGAVALIAVHNHPSGNCQPSSEDVTLTERVAKAAELLGFTLLDHVIVADEGYFSFLDAGLLKPRGA